MILIVTGGIGSGKSAAAGILNEIFGFPVYDADTKVKDLYNRCPDLLLSIERELRCKVRNSDGKFVPRILAEQIFSDEDKLEKVESIVFPALKADFNAWLNQNPSKVQILESATILQKEYFRDTGDYILLLNAPLDLRLSRTIERDNTSEEAVKSRIQMQKDVCDLDSSGRPVWVCENDSTIEDLRIKLTDFVENILVTKML